MFNPFEDLSLKKQIKYYYFNFSRPETQVQREETHLEDHTEKYKRTSRS